MNLPALVALGVLLILVAFVIWDTKRINRIRDAGPVAGRKPLRIHTRAGSFSQERPRPATGTDALYDELRARTELRQQRTVARLPKSR